MYYSTNVLKGLKQLKPLYSTTKADGLYGLGL